MRRTNNFPYSVTSYSHNATYSNDMPPNKKNRINLRSSQYDLSVMSWNIHGLSCDIHGSKLNDPDVINVVNCLDIVGFVETHTNKKSDVNLEGFKCISHSPRPKKKQVGRNSGGIAIFCKNNIVTGIKICPSPSRSADFVWICPGHHVESNT